MKISATSWNGAATTPNCFCDIRSAKTRVERFIFACRRAGFGRYRHIADRQIAAVGGELNRSGIGLDVPGLHSGVTEIESRDDLRAAVGPEHDVRPDRGRVVRRNEQTHVLHKEWLRDELRQNGNCVDAGIQHAETARLPDPGLAGMPLAHTFLPGHPSAADLLLLQPALCGRHVERVL